MYVQVAESEHSSSDEQSPPGSPVNNPDLGAPEGSFASGVDSDSYPDDEAEPIPDWDYSDSEIEATDSEDEAAVSDGEAAESEDQAAESEGKAAESEAKAEENQFEGVEVQDPHVHEGSGTTPADSDMAHGIQSHAQVGQHGSFAYGFPAYSASAQALEAQQHARAVAQGNMELSFPALAVTEAPGQAAVAGLRGVEAPAGARGDRLGQNWSLPQTGTSKKLLHYEPVDAREKLRRSRLISC